MEVSPAISTQLTTFLNYIAKHKLVIVQSHPVLIVLEVLFHGALARLEVFVPPRSLIILTIITNHKHILIYFYLF
jgi:hypothetical protein